MRKTTKIFLLIIFIWVALSTFSIVNAASVDIEAKPTSVKVGEKATVTVTVNAATCNLTVSGSAKDKIVEANLKGENEKYVKTYNIDTSKAGTYEVFLTGDITDGPTDVNTKIEKKSVSITVKAEEKPAEKPPVEQEKPTTPSTPETPSTQEKPTEKPKTKSTNAYLSTLGVRLSESVAAELGVNANEYDFSGFKKSTTTYNVTVPYEVDSLKVSYKTEHAGAKVKVTGNSGFEVGSKNKITIKVTAEDGKTTKTYTIRVTKLAEVEEKPGNIIDEEIEELYLTSLSLKGIELSPEFSNNTYAYTAKLSNSDKTEVEVNATANKENANIEISGNTNLVVGENTINIVVKQEGSTNQTVYQITLVKDAVLVTTTGEEVNFMSNLIDNIKNYVIIAVTVVVLIITSIVVLIILLRKENKKLQNQEIEEENNEEEVENNQEQEVEEEIKEETIEKVTYETETKNIGRRTRSRRKEKGRHSK